MMENTKSPIMLAKNSLLSIPKVRTLYQSTLSFSTLSFSKIVEIEFKLKIQSFFCLEFSKVLAEFDFLYFSLYISK